jgi:pimeloyl-ACP methyl ester carboxylesterase
VPAWRVFLGLPMSGKRAPEGGPEEIMRRASEDALMNVQAPVMEQAAGELPGAIDELRRQLGLEEDAKVALVGTSAGAGAILKALADSDVQVVAVALVNPVSTARAAIEAGERVFGMEYEWTDESSAKAEELDFIQRAGEIAARDGQPAILIIQGRGRRRGVRPKFGRARAGAVEGVPEPRRRLPHEGQGTRPLAGGDA